MMGRYSMQSQNVNLSVPMQYDVASIPQQKTFGTASQAPLLKEDNMLPLGSQLPSTSVYQAGGTSSSTPYRGIGEFIPEDEIRMRSHEMLENEDMQHLLRFINMGGHNHASFNVPEEGYPYSSAYMPFSSQNYNFDDDRTRSSGKAVVGWLKLKAALRWGIFVRKKAAERRAHLEELDDA